MSELEYPFSELPAPGEWLQVADGIFWLRMVLPMALDHINLYVVEDDAGWWIVDTGMNVGDTQQHWQQLFDGPMAGKPVIGVIVTHMHPDHLGQAGWLCEKWRAPLYMSFGEYYQARTLADAQVGDTPGWHLVKHFQQAGIDLHKFMKDGQKFSGFSKVITPIPRSFQRLGEGDVLRIGKRDWQVMIGRGHSCEHVCLFSEADRVFISGDQIIPKITSNVSVMPTEPEANPLAEWMSSLQRFMSLPKETLVLPAHNTPFYGVRQRLLDLLDHHEDHLQALEEACLEPKCAVELLPVLFSRKLDGSQIMMALGECIAHLHYLFKQGRLTRSLDDEGALRYLTTNAVVKSRVGRKHHQLAEPQQI